MPVQATTIMIGVEDIARSKKFYGKGLGCAIDQDYPQFVLFNLGAGSSSLPSTNGKRRRKMPASHPEDRDSGASRSTSSLRPAMPWMRLWPRLWRPGGTS
jgi:catechol 2,3-dioxygenase-like lactoylglutathione lyase family enzyme